jgi:hypothetical protein
MVYFAVGLTVIGVSAGLVFRWKVLIPVIALVPFAAGAVSISRGFGYHETAVVVIAAEAILQGSYFAGLLIRHVTTAVMRLLRNSAVDGGRDPASHGNE